MSSPRIDWDEVWLGTARDLAKRSLCDGGAGACIVAADNRVMFPGYAGPPATLDTSGVTDCTAFCVRHTLPVEQRDPGYTDCQSIHAEINALIHADRTLVTGGSFYISRQPCFQCEKAIRNSGVWRYVWPGTEGKRVVRLTDRGWE